MILFFPFTHTSKEQLKTISAFFSKIGFLPLVKDFTSYPILAELTEQGILEPYFPPAQRLVQVEKQVQSYVDWARLNRGNEKNFNALLKEPPYFFDDTGLASIQSQIRKGTKTYREVINREKSVPEKPDQKKPDQKKPDQNPLLLLKLAQLLDIQNEAIDEQLQMLEQKRAALFSELKGGEGTGNPKKNDPFHNDPIHNDIDPNDPGMVMTRERITAWMRYASEEGFFKENDNPPVLVTTSSAVLDYLMSKFEYVINALDIDSLKVHEDGCKNKQKWQQDLYLFLKEIIVRKGVGGKDLPGAEDGCSLSGQIKLCLFPGASMNEFFNVPGKQVAVCLVKLNHKKLDFIK